MTRLRNFHVQAHLKSCVLFLVLSECQTYGKTFQKDMHHYIWVPPDDMVGGVGGSISNPDQCKELCLAETKFECRLVEYYSPNRICVFFSMNTLKSSSALNYRPSVSYDIYLRDCATSGNSTSYQYKHYKPALLTCSAGFAALKKRALCYSLFKGWMFFLFNKHDVCT